MFYQQELEHLSKQIKNFSYEFVLDKPKEKWNGKTGFVTDYLDEFDLKNKSTHIYLCGNPAMIKGVKSQLSDMGFSKEHIYAEAFY